MNHLANAEQAMKTWNYLVRTEQTMQICVAACNLCHQLCLQAAVNYKMGENPIEINHFRLMMNCAEICQMSANFQFSNSDFHHRLCGICADVCEVSATSCEKIGGMNDCVTACRDCAASCQQMANIQH
jgi:hypothetical protein